jgi:hypothetical protein
MAVKTPSATSLIPDYTAGYQFLTFSVATVADGDTLVVPGFSRIHNAIATPDSAVVVVPTFSGKTITFKVASGTPTCVVSVWGE